MRDAGVQACPLFALPGFRLAFIGIDVLHALDLGVTQDLIGNVMWEYVTHFASGKNLSEKVKSLGLKLQA